MWVLGVVSHGDPGSLTPDLTFPCAGEHKDIKVCSSYLDNDSVVFVIASTNPNKITDLHYASEARSKS